MVSPKKRKIAAARAAAACAAAEKDGPPQPRATKKAKAAAAAAPPPADGDGDGDDLATRLLERHRSTMKALRSNVDEMIGTNDDDDQEYASELHLSSTLALAELKSLQRRIAVEVEARAAASKGRREEVEGRGLVLENLNYERNYLREEIGTMRGWRAGELERMAWSELGLDPEKLLKEGEADGGGGTDDDDGKGDKAANKNKDEDVEMEDAGATKKITTAEEAIDAYLLGDADGDNTGSTTTSTSTSHRDPSNHPRILQKLQSDLKTRSSLVEELSKSKLELKELQKKRDELRGFLGQIPRKIAELERAGESLNKFFGGSNVWKDALDDDAETDSDGGDGAGGTTDGDADGETRDEKKIRAANLLVNRPSCDRAERFRLAKSNLPSPLYVLFVQLAGYMDAWASLEKLGGRNVASDGGGDGKRSRAALDDFAAARGMDATAVPPEEGGDGECPGRWSVEMKLSPSDILPAETSSILGKSTYSSRSSAAAANIKIVFSYSEEEGVVYAKVKDDQNKGLDDGLLDDLFPGDDGLANPNVSLSLLKQDEDGDDDDDSDEGARGDVTDMVDDDDVKERSNGKPYHWCQVLGGLDFPPPSLNPSTAVDESKEEGDDDEGDVSPFQIQTCTKAVFRQLHRRIRARRTLEAILECLGKNRSQMHPLPIHPAMRGSKDHPAPAQPQSIKAKLHSWAEEKEGQDKPPKAASSSAKRYVATIKRKSNTLRATVVVDPRLYPARPPAWSLQNEDGSSGGAPSWGEERGDVSSLGQGSNGGDAPPLFDANLRRIEDHVNRDVGKFANGDAENTYDWILIHQLADVVSCWDEAMSAGEAGGGGGGGRLRKGRDRRLTGFGERSPFFWYRNGL